MQLSKQMIDRIKNEGGVADDVDISVIKIEPLYRPLVDPVTRVLFIADDFPDRVQNIQLKIRWTS